jgi:hypothetical protein
VLISTLSSDLSRRLHERKAHALDHVTNLPGSRPSPWATAGSWRLAILRSELDLAVTESAAVADQVTPQRTGCRTAQ